MVGYGLEDRVSTFGRERNILSAATSGPNMWPTQPPNQWVPSSVSHRTRRPDREADLSSARLRRVLYQLHRTGNDISYSAQYIFPERNGPEAQYNNEAGCGVSPQIPRALCPIAAEFLNASDLSHYLCFVMSSNAADVRAGKQSLDRSVQNNIILKNQHKIPYYVHKHRYSIFVIRAFSFPNSEIMSCETPMAWILFDLLVFCKAKDKILQ